MVAVAIDAIVDAILGLLMLLLFLSASPSASSSVSSSSCYVVAIAVAVSASAAVVDLLFAHVFVRLLNCCLFGCSLLDCNISWQVAASAAVVVSK